MGMKFSRLGFTVAAAALMAVPALAQYTSDGDQFVQAVAKGDGDKATQLIADHPTLIDSRNANGDTGLIIAIRNGDPQWTAFLLQKRADPDTPGAGGDTPLITAAKVSFDDAAEWLLNLGAKVDATNRMGETPLMIAVQQRDAKMVRMLLEAGADPDRTDAAAGYSARDYANRDARARDIQKLINEKKPQSGRSL